MHTLTFVGLFFLSVLAIGFYVRSLKYMSGVAEELWGGGNQAREVVVSVLTMFGVTVFHLGVATSMLFDIGVLRSVNQVIAATDFRVVTFVYAGYFVGIGVIQLILFQPWYRRVMKKYESKEVHYIRRGA